MVTTAFKKAVETAAAKQGASSKGQIASLIDLVAKRFPLTAASDELNDMDLQSIDWSIQREAEVNPRLTMTIPSVAVLVDLIAKDREARGLPFTVEERVALAREVQNDDADARLARVPDTVRTVPKAAAATQTSARPSDIDLAALDAEIERLFGKPATSLTASQRAAYHAEIRKQMRPKVDGPISQQVAAGFDETKLSPENRIRLARERALQQQAAKR